MAADTKPRSIDDVHTEMLARFDRVDRDLLVLTRAAIDHSKQFEAIHAKLDEILDRLKT
jgi:hypothetical protein